MPTTYVVPQDKETKESGIGWQFAIVSDDADIAGAESGDVVVWNSAVGIALTDYDTVHGELMVDFAGAYDVQVTAESGAIELLDKIYYDAAADEFNDDNTGIFVGYALKTIDNGDTETIGVEFASLGVC